MLGLKHEGCRLKHAGCRLKHEGCRLKYAGCRLKHEGCRLKYAGCRLDHAECKLEHAVFGLEYAVTQGFACGEVGNVFAANIADALLGTSVAAESFARAVGRNHAALVLPQGVVCGKRLGIGNVQGGTPELTCEKACSSAILFTKLPRPTFTSTALGLQRARRRVSKYPAVALLLGMQPIITSA